jgi:hypothetical protein
MLRMARDHCPLCHRLTEVEAHSPAAATFRVDCETCGAFLMEAHSTPALLNEHVIEPRRYLLSALTKAARGGLLVVNEEVIGRLRKGVPADKGVDEKIELLVRWFAEQSPEIGAIVAADENLLYPVAWCRSPKEWHKLYVEVAKMGYLRIDSGRAEVLLKGWQWLGERPKAAGHDAFIAMSFDVTLKPVKDAIQRAIEAAGYQALRVDDDDYTGGVVDRIIAQIRRSKFAVADFTGNRGGVYYEAGFATGLGIPVIHTCREDCLDLENKGTRLHFDVAHMIAVPWKEGELPDFEKRLAARVEALFGRGPKASV